MIPFERRLISWHRSHVVHHLFKLLSAQRVSGYFQSRQSAKCITEVSLQLSVRMLKGGDRINMLVSKSRNCFIHGNYPLLKLLEHTIATVGFTAKTPSAGES